MTDRPIIFSAPMVRAILEGRKTQTRRVLKPQPEMLTHAGEAVFYWGNHVGLWPDDWFGLGNAIDGDLPYAIGDRLWVRETWATDDAKTFWYRVDGETHNAGLKWRSPIHMPRWASRITLRVTDVRVQRLQDITPADAIAEGIYPAANSMTIDCDTPNPCDGFSELWDNINAKRGFPWDSNPWVTAITFERELRK